MREFKVKILNGFLILKCFICKIYKDHGTRVLNKFCYRENGCDKTVLAGADTVTVITVFYIKEQIVINSHRDDRN
jgi:hypothetical protein